MVQVINKFFGHEDLSCISLENDSIYNVERKLNVSFPDMYKNIIKTKNGGAVAYRCFNYFDKYRQEECGGSIDLLPLSNDEDSVVKTLQAPPEFFPKGLIPFADDGGGNLTCFDYRNCTENPPIVFWVCGDPEGEDTHFVANNFEEFVNMLYKPAYL